MRIPRLSRAPVPAAGKAVVYQDDTTGTITAKKSDGSTVSLEGGGGGGSGVTGPSSATASQIVLFDGTTGALVKAATTTGMLKAASGVLSAAVADTDYATPAAVTTGDADVRNAIALGGVL